MQNSFAASARALKGPKGVNLRYLARQPIFDRDEKVFGCELLFQATLFLAAIPMLRLAPHWIVRCPKQNLVLRGEPGLLRPIYQLMRAPESGEWETARSICDSLPIDRDVGASSYWQAQQWAREVSRGA